METVTLTFSNSVGNTVNVEFNLLDSVPSSVKEVYRESLLQYLNSPGGKVQTTFSNFGLEERSKEALVSKLESIVSYINSSELCTDYGYCIERTTIPLDYPVEVHNEIHHHFEILMGQVWNPSNWHEIIFKSKDTKLKWAVQGLNDITHELEELVKVNMPPHMHFMLEYDHSQVPLGSLNNLNAVELPIEAKEIFKLGTIEGGVYLNYTQLGKTLEEVLVEDDEEIEFENISAHCLANGSFSICFDGNDGTQEKQELLKSQFIKKAANKGIHNLDSSALTLGRPLIGMINSNDVKALQLKLIEYNKLVAIKFNGVEKQVETYTDKFV